MQRHGRALSRVSKAVSSRQRMDVRYSGTVVHEVDRPLAASRWRSSGHPYRSLQIPPEAFTLTGVLRRERGDDPDGFAPVGVFLKATSRRPSCRIQPRTRR